MQYLMTAQFTSRGVAAIDLTIYAHEGKKWIKNTDIAKAVKGKLGAFFAAGRTETPSFSSAIA